MKQLIKDIIHSRPFQELKKLFLKWAYKVIYNKLQDLINKEVSWAMDITDPRTYRADELVKWDYKESVNLWDRFTIQNQRAYKNGSSMCWPTSWSMGTDILWLEESKRFLKWDGLAKVMFDLWRFQYKGWSYLIDTPKTLKELGLITWYYQVNDIEWFKKVLSEWYPILVWTNKIRHRDWISYLKARWGHMFVCYGYNDIGFLIADPWNGEYWTLQYKHFYSLFNTKLAISSDNKFKKIEEYKEEIKELKKQGLNRMQTYEAISISKKERKEDEELILIAIRRVWNMNVTEEMKFDIRK